MSAFSTDSTQTATSTPLTGIWLTVVRGAWILITIISLATFALFLRYANGYLRQIGDWRRAALFMLGLSNTYYAGYYVTLMAIFVIIYVGVAVFIFWHKSDNRVALLISLAQVTFGVTGAISIHPAIMSNVFRNTTPLSILLLITSTLSNLFVLMSLLLFPDGRFVPDWTKWLAVIALIYSGSLLLRLNNLSPLLLSLLPVVFFGVGIYAQMYRFFRTASPTQRQQTRLMVHGLRISIPLILIVLYVIPQLVPLVRPPTIPAAALAYEMVGGLVFLSLLIVPLALMSSILRYHLWDSDAANNG